jgi:hypothetical protein
MPASIGMPLLPHKRSTTQSRYVELRRVKGFSSGVITGRHEMKIYAGTQRLWVESRA